MTTDAILYKEFIKVWGKPVTSVDPKRAKAWDKFKKSNAYLRKHI